jgi:hypothetical protein
MWRNLLFLLYRPFNLKAAGSQITFILKIIHFPFTKDGHSIYSSNYSIITYDKIQKHVVNPLRVSAIFLGSYSFIHAEVKQPQKTQGHVPEHEDKFL